MKKFCVLWISFLILFNCSFAQTPVEKNGALSVHAQQIVNRYEDPVSLAGNSLFWSNTGWEGAKYYTGNVVRWLYQDWHANIVRAVMGVDVNGGYLEDEKNKERVKKVVETAIETGVYVIIDWHSHHAEKYESEAIRFFREMAALYGETDNVIYEIYNEPLDVSWCLTVKPYAEKVIEAIREIDPDNLIIVGTPNWSQDVDSAADHPIKGYANIVYTLHFYAGSHHEELMEKASYAIEKKLPLFVTEWGTVNANGDGVVDSVWTMKWMDFCCKNHLSHCNWAITDKKEGASALQPGASPKGNWKEKDLTYSGKLVREIIRSWNSKCNR
jgi:aryl-phospho-beta-D-glucosidase BglC (GH1 family)